MTFTLVIGDRAYSSWSLRGWLLFESFGLSCNVVEATLYTGQFAEVLASVPPARTVPVLRTPEGHVVWDSLAIAETLAERYPQAGIWPAGPGLRALARSLAAEMHASFQALRTACPMNLRVAYAGFEADAPVQADLARIEALWAHALAASGGPWLCGAYSAADVFFAPVAGRIAGYGLPVGPEAEAYVAQHLGDPSFRRWRAMALVRGPHQPVYDRPHARRAWPGPLPIGAGAVEAGPAVNETCPYSGRPVTHFMEAGGKVYGFCNAFCRDKTAADPGAWPAFMKIYQS